MIKSLRKPAEWIFLGLLAYMPFHVLLSTWVGTSFDVLTATKILKDVVLVAAFVIALLATDKKALKAFARQRLVWLIAGYALLTIILAAVRPTEQDAEVLGVVYNLRFMLFFLVGALVASWQQKDEFMKRSLKVVLLSGLLVVAFGIFQYILLPDNALRHVGYSKPNGTPPAFFIDDKPDLERVMSTVKDPNSLGSYLIILVCLLSALALRAKGVLKKKYMLGAVLSVACLWLTFSRGALLGLLLALISLFLLEPRSQKFLKANKKRVIVSAIAILCVLTGVVVLARDTYIVKNVVFHADEQTVLEDPNELRLRFWRESLDEIAADPVGSGPGTAGLASIRNQSQGTELNENYYLQIASEVGIVGLALFVAILCVVTRRLFSKRDSPVSRGLLAGLVGLLFTSLLIHTWSNEAIAYVWWGLAGLKLPASTKTKSSNELL